MAAAPSQNLIVACPNCGSKNRVRFDAALKQQPVCGKCKNLLPAPSMEPVVVTDANFAQGVAKSPIPVLLDMWAAWCGPCRIIAPTIEVLARELAGKVVVGKLDVDANPRTAVRFGVQSIPTLLILKNGNEVDRIVGVQSREAILRRLQPFI
ncbi:MAG: thioredoxin [Pyrinomonadaceae bacterium]